MTKDNNIAIDSILSDETKRQNVRFALFENYLKEHNLYTNSNLEWLHHNGIIRLKKIIPENGQSQYVIIDLGRKYK